MLHPNSVTKERAKQRLFQELTGAKAMEKLQMEIHPFEEMMSYYRCAMMETETKFRVLNEQFSLTYDRNPIEAIKTRLKDPRSLLEKVNRKGIPPTREAIEENIFDIAGVRVVCSFPEDIYMLEKCLLQQDDVRLIQRKDYIKDPKPSGYRSLHLVIETPIFLCDEKRLMKVEVQLRTIAMDFWASLEHKLRYKKGLDELESLSHDLLECAEISASLDLKMQELHDRIEALQNGESDSVPGSGDTP